MIERPGEIIGKEMNVGAPQAMSHLGQGAGVVDETTDPMGGGGALFLAACPDRMECNCRFGPDASRSDPLRIADRRRPGACDSFRGFNVGSGYGAFFRAYRAWSATRGDGPAGISGIARAACVCSIA